MPGRLVARRRGSAGYEGASAGESGVWCWGVSKRLFVWLRKWGRLDAARERRAGRRPERGGGK